MLVVFICKYALTTLHPDSPEGDVDVNILPGTVLAISGARIDIDNVCCRGPYDDILNEVHSNADTMVRR